MIRYQMKIHKEAGQYWAEFPDLPGCFTEAKTKEALQDSAREALSLYLEEARDPQWQVPQAKSQRGKDCEWVTPFEDVAIPLMIRQARIKNCFTQKKLAEAIGITIQQLQKLETPGKSNPTVKTLAAISKALNEELEIRLVA